MTEQRNNAKNRAFSLVELVVVVAVLGILAGIAIPQLNLSESARATVAQKNLDDINTAVESYRQMTGGSLFSGIAVPSSDEVAERIESLKITRPNVGPLSGIGLERKPLLTSSFNFTYGNENDRLYGHRGVWNGIRFVLVRPNESATTGGGCINLE